MDVTSLDALLRCWELIEYWAAGFVILGCVGEFAAEFTRIHTLAWGHQLAKASLLVLIAALAVELVALVHTNRLSAKEIAILEQGTAQLEKDAAQLRKEAEQEHLARVQLEKSMMWRHLSKEQGDALCSVIPTKLVDRITVTSSSQDSEAFRYAVDFNEALRRCAQAAGLQLPGGVGNSFWGQSVAFGVWVRFLKHLTLDDPKSNDVMLNPGKRRALAISVRKALEAHGIKVEGISDEGRGLVDICVGPRFPPQAQVTGPVLSKPAPRIE
jgi:hypothetical protein